MELLDLDIVDKSSLPNSPIGEELWDYDSSVEKMQVLILNWKNISTDILNELYIARKVLSSQGTRNDLSDEKKGWSNYCDEIGLSRQTIHNWLKRFDPEKKEIISTQNRVVESVVLPKELEGTTYEKLPTTNCCPHCGYEW